MLRAKSKTALFVGGFELIRWAWCYTRVFIFRNEFANWALLKTLGAIWWHIFTLGALPTFFVVTWDVGSSCTWAYANVSGWFYKHSSIASLSALSSIAKCKLRWALLDAQCLRLVIFLISSTLTLALTSSISSFTFRAWWNTSRFLRVYKLCQRARFQTIFPRWWEKLPSLTSSWALYSISWFMIIFRTIIHTLPWIRRAVFKAVLEFLRISFSFTTFSETSVEAIIIIIVRVLTIFYTSIQKLYGIYFHAFITTN